MSDTKPTIEELLQKILEAVYGKDVRQSIHDAIAQCYSDVGDPTLNEAAFDKAVQKKIDDGSIAAMTLEDGSITTKYLSDGAVTEEKMNTTFLNKLTSSSYITDSEGNKYTVYVNDKGELATKPFYEIPQNGKIIDLYPSTGGVYEAVGKTTVAGFTLKNADTDPCFVGDHAKYSSSGASNYGTDLMSGKSEMNAYTIIIIADSSTPSKNQVLNIGYDAYPIESNIDMSSGTPMYKSYGKRAIGIMSPPYCDVANLRPTLYIKDKVFLAVRKQENGVADCILNGSELGRIADSDKSVKSISKMFVGTEAQNQTGLYRVIVYDRALTKEELYEIREVLYTPENISKKPDHYVQGITELGCPNAILGNLNDIPTWDPDPVTYDTVVWTEPTVSETPTKFESVLFTNPISELEVGDIYNLEAFPYPYNIGNANYLYNIEYISNNPDVLECFDGVLIAKSAGTANIIAKISNVAISKQLSIQVKEPVITPQNILDIQESFTSGLYSLKSENPAIVLRAINAAIQTAAENGFTGVSFPNTMGYNIAPFQKGVNIVVPSNFTIDFNNASMYCYDSEFCSDTTGNGYTLFSFGEHGTNGSKFTECKNSTIKNLKYYGERHQKTNSDTYYSPFCQFAVFAAGGVENCHIKNVRFEDTTGFNISTGMCGFDVWQGTATDGAVRGCTVPSNYQAGRLASDGETITTDSTGMWYCTPTMLKLGYVYSDNPTKSPEMKYYTLGAMGTATRQGSKGWWYELFFYNESQELIEYTGLQMSLDRYLLPEGAVYFKVNLCSWGTPTNQSQVDVQHVVRLWAVGDPYRCSIEDCSFINPHCSAVSWTGGYNCLMKNCYAEDGVAVTLSNGKYGWSIDFEDGWLEMRHNVVFRTICTGLIPNPGGYNTAFVNSIIEKLTSTGSAQEAIKIINCAIRTVNLKYKTNDYINCLTYGTLTSAVSSDVSNATIRQANSVKDNNIGKIMAIKPTINTTYASD